MESWKILLIALGAALIVGSTTFLMTKNTKLERSMVSQEITEAFSQWSVMYNKMYSDVETTQYKLAVFAANYEMIMKHNMMGETYTLGMNQFMDMTKEEFVMMQLTLFPRLSPSPYGVHIESGEVANAVDWRTKGAVTGVKNQASCGSCWAFSAVGALESDAFVQAGSLPTLSEQQLVSCSGSFGNQGCNGGLMDSAFQYVIKNGIVAGSTYPYTSGTGITGQCKAAQTKPVAYTISSYVDVAAGSTSGLQSAVNQQPVSIAVDATNWQFYSSGVFSNCAARLNHGVLAVGYDNSSNWLVKNSWGTSWGAQGYITLKAGNTCGCANDASYPRK